jgi:8-oxo-dGTP pyrophosphatase MutT (NUDIX family)
MRELVPDATWCVSESGACGPTFNYDGISTGFTSICVTGPVTKGVFVESDTADRERNMRLFVQAAIDLLSECITEAAETAARATPNAEAVPAAASTAAEPERFKTVNDRYGGVMATAISGVTATEFAAVLAQRIPAWKAEGKRGLWLKIPAECADLVGPAVSAGLAFHHAKPEYVQLTMWLPETSSPLPLYSFTQIGVGGVVVNSQGEVLMVQERVSPAEQYQGSWKLPGGLADPGESFAQTAQREVHEETGVTGELDGVVSLRHTHGVRFGQGDLYVLVRLRATSEKLVLDDHEIAVAEWMHPDRIKSLVEWDHTKMYKDKVSKTNWEMISNAVYGRLVSGTEMPSTRGASMLYVAS